MGISPTGSTNGINEGVRSLKPPIDRVFREEFEIRRWEWGSS